MSFRRILETEVLCCHPFELSAKFARRVAVPQPACVQVGLVGGAGGVSRMSGSVGLFVLVQV